MTEESEDRSRVVVKFHDRLELPYEDGVETYLRRRGLGPWHQLFAQFPGITLTRLFTSVPPEQIRELVNQGQDADEDNHSPNLLTYFAINCPPGMDAPALVKALSAWPIVQTAYVESGPAPPPTANAADDPDYGKQDYLRSAPGGIDAVYAWTQNGGDGAGIDYIDLEQGWVLDHEDLVGANIQLLSPLEWNHKYFGHGTAALGVIAAVDNKTGGIGIAPSARGRVVSQYRLPTHDRSIPEAILRAVIALRRGDVLLLEAQSKLVATVSGHQVYEFFPVELESGPFAVIRKGANKGIIIVEAAGNGAQDFDGYTNQTGGHTLKRGDAKFRDSGAIMVGAATKTFPHDRHFSSNFGSRIDCYSWGESIFTTGSRTFYCTNTEYTADFGETSGASAIIAGAAIVVQGIAQAKNGARLGPKELRTRLSDPANGTPSANPTIDNIGVMPDLKKIVAKI